MGNQVRIITTKRGYGNIIRSLKIFNNEKIINDLINEKTCQVYGEIVFLKWDNPKSHKMIQNIIMSLMSHRNSYKICEIDGEIVNTYCNEIEYKKLPVPVMDCKFNDEETIKKLYELQKNRRNGGKNNGI